MKIGNVIINKKAVLAPMAGVSDKAFREICVKFGAGYTITEMVSSKGISYMNKKTLDLMDISKSERPCGIQIFGENPETMAQAAKLALTKKPDIIDINMGCPAPKVNKSGGGAILLKNPELCYKIVKSVKKNINVPLTVKIRKGWDENSVNAVEIARLCELAGANAITIHGRTREQMYKPSVDLNIIKEVKKSVKIPVIGNGDIKSAKDAINMLKTTGCDLIMVGRAAIGNPFIFKEINYALLNKSYKKPTPEEKISVMTEHIFKICQYKGERIGMKEARRHICMYLKGMTSACKFRNEACMLTSFHEYKNFKDRLLNSIIIDK